MKDILKIWIFVGFLGLFATACSEDEVSVYSGPDAINIMINNRDSAEISFLSLDPEVTEYTFNIDVNIQSVSMDRDREVKFGLGEKTTAKDGENFEMIYSVVIPKGETSVKLPIKIFKEGLADIEGGLVSEIVVLASNDFVTGVKGKVKLLFSGDFPKSWYVDGYSFWVPYNLGRCTKAKYEFVFSILKTIDLTPYEDMYGSINLMNRLNAELDAWAAAHGGERLPDDDGSDMKFSPQS